MSQLKMDNVSYCYRKSNSYAVKMVSCTFELGQLYVVMGPSGSGKTTLLSLMAGLDYPTDGVISFDGTSLSNLDLDKYRRENIAMIFQAFHLFPLLTVIENVCYPMVSNGVHPKNAKIKAEELLLQVGITREKFNRFPSNLSGGEQQRVAISRSLASGAKVLLADEPTGNLDVSNSENIMGILSALAHDEGYCVIIVTHDMDVTKKADKVLRMTDGELGADVGFCI